MRGQHYFGGVKMNFDLPCALAPLTGLIEEGRLYPAIVLHGATDEDRRDAGLYLARTILCLQRNRRGPCGECRNCRRVTLEEDQGFHPDFHPLARDRPTATSAAAVRAWVGEAQLAAFEAGAKVFVMLEAETLGDDAADVLLKVLEEPPGEARHFLLLAPSDRELPPTVRSRSMSFYLGESADQADDERVVEGLTAALAGGGPGLAPRLAAAILSLDEWKDPRAATGWERAARALIAIGESRSEPWLLDLAADLMQAPRWRIRGVPAHRIVEGSVAERVRLRAGMA